MPEVGGGVQLRTDVEAGRMEGVDLQIFVRKEGSGDRTILHYGLELAGEQPEKYSSVQTDLDPHSYFTEFWYRFNRLVKNEEGQLSERLADLSSSLTQQVLPEDLRKRLWELKDDVETVQIRSDESWIPWELLRLLHRTGGSQVQGQFLSEAFTLTRWHGAPKAARRRFSLRSIACLVTNPSMAKEAEELRRLWAGKCHVKDWPSDYLTVRQRMIEAEFEGLYLFGHGQYEGGISDSVGIVLENGNLNPDILDGPAGGVGASHPLIFFNTCQSARSGQALIDTTSWATKFIDRGAAAFIGTSWAIRSKPARLFATTFYEGFLQGSQIGVAVKEARAKVRDLFPEDPTWLAYVVYAHPLAVYQRGSDELDLEPSSGQKARKALLAITSRPAGQADDEELEKVLETACSQVKEDLGVEYLRYRTENTEALSLGFSTLDEAHDFGVALLEAVQIYRLDSGARGPYLCIGLGSKARSTDETTSEQISRAGPTGQMLIDVDSWSRLSSDRQAMYGARESLRPADHPLAIVVRRARVTRPAPEEVDLVKLQEGKGLDPDKPPYIGPDFFKDASQGFFGRGREIRDLCEKIETNDYTLVYAASGAGKSSLVHTGVRGHFDPEKAECILVRYYLPSERIAAGDANIFLACIRAKLNKLLGKEEAPDENRLAGGEEDLADLLAALPWRKGRKRLLILDQFENSLLKDDDDVADAREKFFFQLRLALKEFDELKLVLVFREEYLAKIKDLCEPIRESGSNGAEFYLKNLDERAALEVIRNHARMVGVDYEEGLAEKIVRQLSKNKEIAPVQLQVVCRMIWKNLDAKGVKRITSSDVAKAADESIPGASKGKLDKTLQKFIKSCVERFYDDTLYRIATEDRDGLGIEVGLLHIGCMEFVSSSSHHEALKREDNKVGRLPEAIVKRLEDEYLIRRVEREGKSYYELIHDTVAEAISAGGHQFQVRDFQAKRSTKDPNKLLYALKSLEFLVKRYKTEAPMEEEDDESPNKRASFRGGLFLEHDETLKSIEGFQRQGLFEDEAEFVLRCVLASDEDSSYLNNWAKNIAGEYPKVFNRVLLEAICISAEDLATAREGQDHGDQHKELREQAKNIRRNAVLLAGPILETTTPVGDSSVKAGIREINDSIVKCALRDDDTSVWQAAVASLAKLEPESFSNILKEEMGPSSETPRNRIYDIFAHLGELSYEKRAVLTPAEPWPRLDLWSRMRVFSKMWSGRLKENYQLLMIALVLALLLTPPFTAALRGPFAAKGLTHTQEEDGAFQGVFHSVAAGSGWVFSITIPLLLYWILFEREGKPDPRLRRRWIPAAVGGFGGFVGGVLATSMVLLVFNTISMLGAGWLDPAGLPDLENSRPHLKSILMNAFFDTRFGWIFPITGTFMGAGVALLISAVACDTDWRNFSEREAVVGPLKGEWSRVKRISLAIVKILVTKPHALPLLTLPFVGALISYWLLVPGSEMNPEYLEILLPRSLCDVMTLISGALGCSTGILYSFIVDSAGVEWVNRGRRKNASWS